MIPSIFNRTFTNVVKPFFQFQTVQNCKVYTGHIWALKGERFEDVRAIASNTQRLFAMNSEMCVQIGKSKDGCTTMIFQGQKENTEKGIEHMKEQNGEQKTFDVNIKDPQN